MYFRFKEMAIIFERKQFSDELHFLISERQIRLQDDVVFLFAQPC